MSINGLPSEIVVIWKSAGAVGALDGGGFQGRHLSVLKLAATAAARPRVPDFGPLFVHTGDQPDNNRDPNVRSFAFSTADGFFDTPVPDFVFDAWPETGIDDYQSVSTAMALAGDEPAETGALGWIGNCNLHPTRRVLYESAQLAPGALDIQHHDWVAPADGEPVATTAGNYMSLPEQVTRWSFLFDVEGRGYSGRLKLLLHAGRPVFVQERPWREWFWSEFLPMQHFIPVQRDLSDLMDRLRWAHQNPEAAERIGRAGRALAQSLLTRATALDVWEQILCDAADDHRSWAPADVKPALESHLSTLGLLATG
jgi:hypothetical protein